MTIWIATVTTASATATAATTTTAAAAAATVTYCTATANRCPRYLIAGIACVAFFNELKRKKIINYYLPFDFKSVQDFCLYFALCF